MVEYPNLVDTNYFTKRSLKNDKGEEKGSLMMWRIKGKPEFHFIMKCPYCGQNQERDEIMEKRPYRISCEKCSNVIVVEKIKKKAKE